LYLTFGTLTISRVSAQAYPSGRATLSGSAWDKYDFDTPQAFLDSLSGGLFQLAYNDRYGTDKGILNPYMIYIDFNFEGRIGYETTYGVKHSFYFI